MESSREVWASSEGIKLNEWRGVLSSTPLVLYADASGEFAPLQSLYWSASHGLVSTNAASSSAEPTTPFCPSCFEVTPAQKKEAFWVNGYVTVVFADRQIVDR